MNEFTQYIKTTFDGILIFGDVHGDLNLLSKAHTYAIDNNLFFVSTGDLVDRGKNPYETVQLMYSVVRSRTGAFTVGNHDDKFYRYAKGNQVHLSHDAKQTLVDVGAARMDSFLSMYVDLIEDMPYSRLYHNFDDIYVSHAAAHANMFSGGKITKSESYVYLVGETNGERYDNGYPVRLYNWVNNIPAGKTVIVGHDRTPVNYLDVIDTPVEKLGSLGGRAIFIDTGCGKGGHLTGAIIKNIDNNFSFDRFINFS